MDKNNRKKLLLFDLDDTLLRSDKTISEQTFLSNHLQRGKNIRDQSITDAQILGLFLRHLTVPTIQNIIYVDERFHYF